MSLTPYATRPHPRAQLLDPRARYRKRRLRRAPQRAAAPSAAEPAAAPQDRAAAARWQRITELNARLGARLDGEAQALWLALEEALHVHWLDVAVDHYNRGYEAGCAQAWLDRGLSRHAAPRDKLRALATALQELVDQLEARSSH